MGGGELVAVALEHERRLWTFHGSDCQATTLEGGDLVTESLPAYGTLNFAFGGSFGDDDRFRYGIHINNILAKVYRSSFDEIPGVGRSIELTARLKF